MDESKSALFDAIAAMGKAFASPRRLELLDLLAQAPRTVDELAQASGQTTANTSQHLQALHPAGMVARRREGTRVRYSLAGADGEVPGAIVIERNHLEWRCDPDSSSRIPEAVDHDVPWIVMCNQGYSSSLAAASLQTLGLHRATDLTGGFQAWRAAGLPVVRRA